MTQLPEVTPAMLGYAIQRKWRVQGGASAPPGCQFADHDGTVLMFKDRSGNPVRISDFPAPAKVEPLPTNVADTDRGTITVGEVRDLLAALPRGLSLVDAGLQPEVLAAIAKMLSTAPPVKRQLAATTRVNRGFRWFESAEALGL